jgi:hypothetical protein
MEMPDSAYCWHWTWNLDEEATANCSMSIYRCTRCDYPIATDHGNPTWLYRKEKIIDIAKNAAAITFLATASIFIVAVGVSIIALAVQGAN